MWIPFQEHDIGVNAAKLSENAETMTEFAYFFFFQTLIYYQIRLNLATPNQYTIANIVSYWR